MRLYGQKGSIVDFSIQVCFPQPTDHVSPPHQTVTTLVQYMLDCNRQVLHVGLCAQKGSIVLLSIQECSPSLHSYCQIKPVCMQQAITVVTSAQNDNIVNL